LDPRSRNAIQKDGCFSHTSEEMDPIDPFAIKTTCLMHSKQEIPGDSVKGLPKI
jgi:hypothetical protein